MGVQSSTQWPRSWSFMGNRSNDREQDDNLASQRLLTIPENAVVVTFENPYYNSVNNDISYDKHKKNMIGYEYNLEEYE